MYCFKFILASILALAAATSAQASVSLTPQQVSELYFKTLLQTDVAAMTELNANLQPARNSVGRKGVFIDIDEMLKADASFTEELAVQVMEQLKLSKNEKAALKPNVLAWFQAVRDAQKRISCTFGAVRPVTQGVAAGYKMVTVDFYCMVVNLRERVNEVLERSVLENWSSLYRYQQEFTAATRAFQSATLTRKFSGKFPLTSKVNMTIWQNQFPREALDVSDLLY